MAMDKLFKGILQVSQSSFSQMSDDDKKGHIIFVRKDTSKLDGDAEVWFGTRRYGNVEATRLAQIETNINGLDGRVDAIEGALGEWTKEFTGNLETVASIVKGHDTKLGEHAKTLDNHSERLGSIELKFDEEIGFGFDKDNSVSDNITRLDNLIGEGFVHDGTDITAEILKIQESLGADGDTGRAIAAAQADVDALEKVVGAPAKGETAASGIFAEIVRVEGIADAAQTADEVSTAIETKINALNLGTTYEAIGTAQGLIDNLGGSDDDTDHGVKVTVTSSKGEVTSVDVEVTGALSEFELGDKKRWDDHLADTDIHVTAQQKTDWQNATNAINAFLDENATKDEVINTLVEIREYLDGEDGAVPTLLDDVASIKASLAAGGDTAKAIAAAQADVDALEIVVGAPAKGETAASGIFAEIADLNSASHTHDNKTLLDTYTQTEANLADAVSKKHEHTNKTELDKIAEGDKKKWDDHVVATDVHVTTADKEKWNSVADGAIREVIFRTGSDYIEIDLAEDQQNTTPGVADGQLLVSTDIANIKETEKKLADAYAVKTYVDSQISTNAIYYGGDDAE